MVKVSIKTGDTVLVTAGKDSGKKGKVLAVKKSKDCVRVVVEGVNVQTKAKKAKTAQDKSEFVKIEGAIDISNVNVVCPKCGKAVRVAHKIVDGKNVRVCPKCGAVLDNKFVKEEKTKKTAEKPAEEKKTAEKPAAKKEQKSNVAKPVKTEEKATKTATVKKPTTVKSSQRGV